MGKYILGLVVGVVVMACDDEGGPSFKQDIIGSWDVTVVVEEFHDDTLYISSDHSLEAHFVDSQTGYTKSASGFKQIYDWYYQDEPAHVIFIYQPTPPLNPLGQSRVFTVVEQSALRQVWTYTTSDIVNSDIVYKHTWNMNKQ